MSNLDYYFDYACPWCYLGTKTVRELAKTGVNVTYHVWKMPQGEGITPPPPKPEGYYEEGKARLKQLSAELDMTCRAPVQSDTVPALLATKIAQEMGAAEAFVEAVFRAHWGEKQDISDRELLVELAAASGLDRDAFRTALEQDAGRAAFEQDMKAAHELEITTIPSYLNGDKRILIHHFADMPTLAHLEELAR